MKTKPVSDLLGAHMSISGGVQESVARAVSINCTAMQIFTKNSNQWSAKPLAEKEITEFKRRLAGNPMPVVAHDSYLINLCAANPAILQKSRDAFTEELRRCGQLGIRWLNFHPGNHVGAGVEQGIALIIESLNLAHEAAKGLSVLSTVEATAGQGTAIGSKFEEIAQIITGVDHPERMAVCIDTCHIFAAGYDISTDSGYKKTMTEFDRIIGIEKLAAFHLNDSKKGLGSRVDRHDHIGKGTIGIRAFELIMNDKRFDGIPKILETPKSEDMHEDAENLKILRGMLK